MAVTVQEYHIYRVIWEPSVGEEFMVLHEVGMVMVDMQWGPHTCMHWMTSNTSWLTLSEKYWVLFGSWLYWLFDEIICDGSSLLRARLVRLFSISA